MSKGFITSITKAEKKRMFIEFVFFPVIIPIANNENIKLALKTEGEGRV